MFAGTGVPRFSSWRPCTEFSAAPLGGTVRPERSAKEEPSCHMTHFSVFAGICEPCTAVAMRTRYGSSTIVMTPSLRET